MYKKGMIIVGSVSNLRLERKVLIHVKCLGQFQMNRNYSISINYYLTSDADNIMRTNSTNGG